MKKNNVVIVEPNGVVKIQGVSPELWLRDYIKSLFPNHVFTLEERADMSDGRYSYELDPGFSEGGPPFMAVVHERARVLKETIQNHSQNSLEEFYKWCICSSASPNDYKMIAWQEVEKFRKTFSGEE